MIKLKNIVNHFAYKGELISIEPTGNGHINKTFKVVTTERRYILQVINSYVFPDVAKLMNNLIIVTESLIDNGVFTLRYKPTLDGKIYYEDNGSYYRLSKYIDNAICYEGVSDFSVIKNYGIGFGQFHKNLSSIDPKRIYDVIPNFHNTPARYSKFLASVENDPVGRVKAVKEQVNFLTSTSKDAFKIAEALEKGKVHLAITHNDPKINNVLFNRDNGEVKAVIDLDTVMTGSFLYDVGDGLRSLFTGENEDNKDTSLLKVNLDAYKAYLEGYYSEMKEVLNKKEIELLPWSIVAMTYELCIRFLKDYIDGDVYFSISYPTHNLDRANTQIALLKDIYANMDKLVEITNEICK